MKKITLTSVIAMIALVPMGANATAVSGEPAHIGENVTAASVTATAVPEYALAEQKTTDDNVVSAGYVKGAYNAAIKAINKVNANAQSNLSVTGGNGVNNTNGVISLDISDKGGLQLEGEEGSKTVSVVTGNGIQKDNTGALGFKAADGGISVTSSGVSLGITSDKGLTKGSNGTLEIKNGNGIALDSNGVNVSAKANSGVKVDSNGVAIDYDNSTIDINASTNKLQVKDGSLTTDKLTTASKATGSTNNTTLTTKGYVDDAISGLGLDNYATKTGTENTIKAMTFEQGTVTQSLTGNVASTTGTWNIMTNWSDETAITPKTYVTGVSLGTLASNVSLGNPIVNQSSVSYANNAGSSGGSSSPAQPAFDLSTLDASIDGEGFIDEGEYFYDCYEETCNMYEFYSEEGETCTRNCVDQQLAARNVAANEWAVTFPYGTVYGTVSYSCSCDRTDLADTSRISGGFSGYWYDDACTNTSWPLVWCQVTGFEPSGSSTKYSVSGPIWYGDVTDSMERNDPYRICAEYFGGEYGYGADIRAYAFGQTAQEPNTCYQYLDD